MTEAVVHVVHAIDTEGPLHEPLAATFERLKSIFGIDLPPSADTLARLQRGEIGLQGRETAVARMVSDSLLRYNVACCESLAGRTENAIEDLRIALRDDPGMRSMLGSDTDLDPIRSDPAFAELLDA